MTLNPPPFLTNCLDIDTHPAPPGSLVRPKVVKSVHYCPATGNFLSREYRDVTSTAGGPTGAVYPTRVSWDGMGWDGMGWEGWRVEGGGGKVGGYRLFWRMASPELFKGKAFCGRRQGMHSVCKVQSHYMLFPYSYTHVYAEL